MTEEEYFNIIEKDDSIVKDVHIYYKDSPAIATLVKGDKYSLTVAFENIDLDVTYSHMEAREYLEMA